MTERRSKSKIVPVAIVAIGLAVVATLIWHVAGPRHTPSGQPPLVKLSGDNFDVLRSEFNAHAGKPRLVVLLSPT